MKLLFKKYNSLNFKIFIITLFIFGKSAICAEKPPQLKDLEVINNERTLWGDFKTSLIFAGKGSYLQFKGTQNQILWGISALTVAYYFKNDKEIAEKAKRPRENEKLITLVSDIGIGFNTPIISALFYSWGRKNNDEKMIRFSQELFATSALSLIETAIISAFPVHQRPNTSNLSFIEKSVRGTSSFPSGHVIGFAALTFKSFQFYGWPSAIIPGVLTFISAFERIHTEKHYISDVIASTFITLLASEGVRAASNYSGNNSLYKKLLMHEFKMGYIRKDKAPGLVVSFKY